MGIIISITKAILSISALFNICSGEYDKAILKLIINLLLSQYM